MSYTLDIGLYSKRVPVFPKKSSPNSSTLAMHLILKKKPTKLIDGFHFCESKITNTSINSGNASDINSNTNKQHKHLKTGLRIRERLCCLLRYLKDQRFYFFRFNIGGLLSTYYMLMDIFAQRSAK